MRRPYFISTIAVIFLITLSIGCITPRKGPTKAYQNAVAQGYTFDAIIVPGIPFANGNWDSVMKARVIWSWVLYKNRIAKNIIYSGGAVYTPFTEAYIMGLYGQALGIPKQHIFYDTLARHSTENVYYSYKLAKQLGFQSLAFASDPFQSLLLKGYTRKRFSTPIYHIPFITDTLKVYQGLSPHINPKPALRLDGLNLLLIQKHSCNACVARWAKTLTGTNIRMVSWGHCSGTSFLCISLKQAYHE